MIYRKRIWKIFSTEVLPTSRIAWHIYIDTLNAAGLWNTPASLGSKEQVIVYTGSSNDYPDFLGGTETSYDPHIEKSKYSVKNMRIGFRTTIYRDPFSWSGPAPTITIYQKREKYNYNLNGSLNSKIITYKQDSSAWTSNNIIPNNVTNNNIVRISEDFVNPFGTYKGSIQTEDISQASCDLNITDSNYGAQASEIVFL